MALKLNQKTKKWIIYGKYKNVDNQYKSYQKQTGFTSKKKAADFDKSYKEELSKKIIQKEGMTFHDLIDLFLKSKKYSIRTEQTYLELKKRFNFYISEINLSFIRKKIENQPFQIIQNLKAILNFAYKYRYIDQKLSDFIINVKEVKQKNKFFDSNLIIEEKNYFFQNGVELNNVMFFLLDTGLRLNEMISLTFDRIHDDHIEINRQLIYNNDKKWVWAKLKSKNSERKIPITKRMKKIISKQPYTEKGFLFGGATKMSLISIETKMREKYSINPHALRHTHATNLIEYSYDVLGYCDKDNIAKHMGHTVQMLETTYKHLFRDKKHEILQILEYINEKD